MTAAAIWKREARRKARRHAWGVAAWGVAGALALAAAVFAVYLVTRYLWESVLCAAFLAALRVWWPRS